MAPYIVSITSDRSPGGIANSLITYSRAMATAGLRHIIILPKNASIIAELSALDHVEIIQISRTTLRFHLMTRFYVSSRLQKLFAPAALIFVHNARHIKSFGQWAPKMIAINHTGKLRHLQHAQRIMFLNHAAQSRFHAAHPLYAGKTCVIHHAFDLPEQDYPARPARDQVLIVSAGRLLIKKGVACLIHAAAHLQAENIACTIRIFGAGEDEPHFQSLIQSLGLHNLEIRPWVADLHAELRAADIFCLPSQGESFPLVIGEAMQAGTPIVSTRTDGMMDYVARCEKPFSLLCDIDDDAELSRQLAALVKDSEQRVAYGQNAFEMAQRHFSLQRLGRDFENLIQETQES